MTEETLQNLKDLKRELFNMGNYLNHISGNLTPKKLGKLVEYTAEINQNVINLEKIMLLSKSFQLKLKYDFTNRELSIIEQLAYGYTSKEIGENLHISGGTVKNHLTTIYKKLGLRNRAQLVKWYIEIYK